MIIKLLCSMEAYHTPLLWTTQTIVSNVPLYIYFRVLLFDFFLYYLFALLLAWNNFRIKEKINLSLTSQHSVSGTQQLFNSRSWFNLTRLGIPFTFQSGFGHYTQIPEDDIELKTLGDEKNYVSVLVSSLCKSYETIDGSPIEVLKNLNGELRKGTVTTLLGRFVDSISLVILP